MSLMVLQNRSSGPSMPWFSPTCSLACRWPWSQKRSIQQVKHLPNWKQWRLSSGRGLQLVLEDDWSRRVLWEQRQPRTQAVGDLSHHRNHTADFLFHGAYDATDPNLFSKWHIVLHSTSFPMNNFASLFSPLKVILVLGNFIAVFQKSGKVFPFQNRECPDVGRTTSRQIRIWPSTLATRPSDATSE